MNSIRVDTPLAEPNGPTFAEVTVRGPGVDITRPIDEATMAGIIAFVFGTTPVSAGAAENGGQVGRGKSGEVGGQQPEWGDEVTLGEFIIETGASTFQQKICAAGYYLMNFQGAESFTSGDVKTALADAHEDMPANFSRDFSASASKNLIARKHGGEVGQFIIPRTGRTAVESNFEEVPKRRSRRSNKKASSPYSESSE